MSTYDCRTSPAYENPIDLNYAKNPYILKWWSPAHDQLIVEQIEKEQWLWYWGILDKITAITLPETSQVWQNADPLCSKYAWRNVLMYFVTSRAEILRLTKKSKEPKWKTCPLCKEIFVENSLPVPLVKRLGIDQLDFCAPCLKDTVLQGTGSNSLSKEEVLSYLRDLSSTLQQVPNQGYGEGIEDLYNLNYQERLAVLQFLRNKPTVRHVKELFGSWLNALVEAGVLEDGTRRMSRGTQSIGKDGHVCFSLGEKTIDEFLYSHGVPHEKEPHYPDGKLRGDFTVNGIFIEYFGLQGNPEYDVKTKQKQHICRKYGIMLISIYPNDLISRKKLERKLLGGLYESD